MLKKYIKDLLTPAFYHAWLALTDPKYTYYVFKGGRNSGKSTFVSMCIIILMMKFPVNTLVVRKVANTLSESVYEQLIEAIELLGVTDYWKRSKSPLGLTYLPTGNRIIFRGADDPMKLKSIKTHRYPIAILWIEEVTEFKNEDEVSTIVNSVIRAGLPDGLKYHIFFTYNPPRSLSSWVNVKYNTSLISNDTYVHHSTVNDNPYISKQLRDNLIELQATNPERYRWEFLGEAVGSGVMPFDNLVFREITDEEIRTFDNYRCGIDWGYANDAFAYVRWHYDKKHRIIYAVDERYGVRLSDRENADWLKAKGYANDHTYIIADSSEPKTIDLYRNDYNVTNILAATKGPGSVETGEKWLNDEILEIVIDERRTPNIGREFRTIDYARTKDGTILSRLVDLDNHCIAEGTLITTDEGQRPIETVCIGDKVLTRDGFKRVSKVWDNGVRDVVMIKLTNGYSLTATHDHKLFVNSERYIPIDTIRYTDDVCCLKKSFMKGFLTDYPKMDIIDRPAVVKTISRPDTYTARYGKQKPILRYLKDIIFITKTRINLIMIYPTLNVLKGQNIYRFTQWSFIKIIQSLRKQIWISKDHLPWNGIGQKQVICGTLNTLKQLSGVESQPNIYVNNVGKSISRSIPEIIDFVQTRAKQNTDAYLELTTSHGYVRNAAKSLYHPDLASLNVVATGAQIVSVQDAGKMQVYDLTIEESHEYFANGILVHNCIDASRYSFQDDIGVGTYEDYGFMSGGGLI